ncbi:MAG: LegC family aminotransferase [Halioglobus sp.]
MNSNPESAMADGIVSALKQVMGPQSAILHEPTFRGREWDYLKDCLDSTFVSSVGAYVDRFEEDLARFTGAEYAIAVVNGTAALHTALLLAGVSRDDEVLIPALTFVATANAVHYCGAHPHFVDSEETTLGLDARKLRDYLSKETDIRSGQCINRATGRTIRALVPMHTFGHPVDIDGLLRISEDFNLVLIEDAAESLGSYYHGQHTGTFGQTGILSFNGNKTITTGGGGAILTNDRALALRAKHLTTTAKLPHAWEYRHDEVGFNYRMPNLNAALGCAQLEQLPQLLEEKRLLHRQYQEALSEVPGLELVTEPDGCKSNFWLQAIKLNLAQEQERDMVLAKTNGAGYMTRPIWELMSNLKPYRNHPSMDLSVSSSLARRVINLPSNFRPGQ